MSLQAALVETHCIRHQCCHGSADLMVINLPFTGTELEEDESNWDGQFSQVAKEMTLGQTDKRHHRLLQEIDSTHQDSEGLSFIRNLAHQRYTCIPLQYTRNRGNGF